jgi:hypothetical protein
MHGLVANVVDNPILTRELRRRMRGKALIYSIITYITLMTISTVFVLLIYSPSPWAEANQEMLQDLQRTGRTIFGWITGIQVLLVLIVAPTITAGLTTGEKERKTFDFLRVTTITRWMYVVGCFLSTAFYVGLALICALPLLSLSFLYGGVALGDVMRTFVYLLGASCVLSAFGLFVSSVCERTRTAQGIIVFMIFALLFGGFVLYQQIAITFAGAAAAQGATGAAVTGTMYLFNFAIAEWLLKVLGMATVAAIFLLLAARKLFDPDETRAFSHWQFAVISGGLMAAAMGLLLGGARSEVAEYGFILTGSVFLLVAVMCFAVGRMEVGDEIWHLKRLFPFLRPIDQTIPFLVFVAVAWYLTLQAVPSWLGVTAAPPKVFETVLLSSLGSFAFFVFVARLVSGLTSHRKKASGITLVVVIFFWIILPLLVAAASALIPSAPGLWRELFAFSPGAACIDAFNTPAAYAATATAPGRVAAVTYVVLALIVAAIGETIRWRRWRHFNYHYDMPAG